MYLIRTGLFWMREGAPRPQVRLPSSPTVLALLNTFETILEALSEAPGPWHPRNPLRDPLCQLHVCVARNCLLALQAGGICGSRQENPTFPSQTLESSADTKTMPHRPLNAFCFGKYSCLS